LDKAKRHIREARQVVIVEGYMDVMQAWQSGFCNVVAQMGTALTEEQLQIVKRYTKRFVLALDADAAGIQATMRSLEVARGTLDREADVRFDARGLIRNEGRLQADIRVVTLPDGRDPDDIIRADPTEWPRLVAQAKPIVAYGIDVVTAGLDMDHAKANTAAAQRILPHNQDIADPIEREHYRQLLARTLRIDERVLHKVTVPNPPARAASGREPKADSARAKAGAGKEQVGLAAVLGGRKMGGDLSRSNFLCQILHHPQVIPQVNRRLAVIQQPVVGKEDFTRPEDKALWSLVQEKINGRPVSAVTGETIIAAIGNLWDSLEDDILQRRVKELMLLPEIPETELERLPDYLVSSVLDWRLEQIKGQITEVNQLFKEAGAEEKKVYSEHFRELSSVWLRLKEARGAMSTYNRRQLDTA
jgi:DNA primase